MADSRPLRTELELAGREVLVVGAGPAALPRIAGLRAAGADVVVVTGLPSGPAGTAPAGTDSAGTAPAGTVLAGTAPAETAPAGVDPAGVDPAGSVTPGSAEVSDAVTDLAERGLIRLHRRPAGPADWATAWIAAPATGDPGTDAAVVATAATHRLLSLPPSAGSATGRGVDQLGAATGPPAVDADRRVGRVVLVGGGPGDPDLITVAGRRAVRQADVVVTDRLAPLALLDEVRPGTEIVDVAKVPAGPTTGQDEINRILVDRGQAGKVVVRLKGGDGFVFGRGAEEWQACAAAGLPVTVIPGLSSAVAVPGLAGIPLTHRDLNQGFTVVSGHVRPDDPRSILDWAALARTGTALVVLMGVRTLPAIARTLIDHGLPADTPASTVADGGLPGQRVVRAPLDRIAEAGDEAGIRPPAITVIGSVAGFDPRAD